MICHVLWFVGLLRTVNLSTLVYVGSSPTAPTLYPEQYYADPSTFCAFPLLRSFYALDCSKPAQSIPLLPHHFPERYKYPYFLIVTSETHETISTKLVSFNQYVSTTNVTEIRQFILQLRKYCVNLIEHQPLAFPKTYSEAHYQPKDKRMTIPCSNLFPFALHCLFLFWRTYGNY
jgi:hypothetical protein